MRGHLQVQAPISEEEVGRRISEAGIGTRIPVQAAGRRTVEVEAGTRIPVREVGRRTAEEELGRNIPVQVLDSRCLVAEECSTLRAKGTCALLAALERSNRT
jgi:hypothetical protein